jgi:hypothetical protein
MDRAAGKDGGLSHPVTAPRPRVSGAVSAALPPEFFLAGSRPVGVFPVPVGAPPSVSPALGAEGRPCRIGLSADHAFPTGSRPVRVSGVRVVVLPLAVSVRGGGDRVALGCFRASQVSSVNLVLVLSGVQDPDPNFGKDRPG